MGRYINKRLTLSLISNYFFTEYCHRRSNSTAKSVLPIQGQKLLPTKSLDYYG
jgi:hypothetical protein